MADYETIESSDGQKKLKQILDNYQGDRRSINGRRGCGFDTSVLLNYRKYLKHKIRSLESVNKSSTLYYELPMHNGLSLVTMKSPNMSDQSDKISKSKSKRRTNSSQSSKNYSKHNVTSLSSKYSMIPSQLNEYLQSNFNRSVHKKPNQNYYHRDQKNSKALYFNNSQQQQSNFPTFSTFSIADINHHNQEMMKNNNSKKFDRIIINDQDYPYF